MAWEEFNKLIRKMCDIWDGNGYSDLSKELFEIVNAQFTVTERIGEPAIFINSLKKLKPAAFMLIKDAFDEYNQKFGT